jgi:hypothetical protein
MPITDSTLELIKADLRRQRDDLNREIAERTSSQGQTAELLKKIEALRVRMERNAHIDSLKEK